MTDLRELEKRLEDATGCVLWPGKTDDKGRGRVSLGGKLMLAHRAVWTRVIGPIPVGMMLCHTCDNSGCVNPRHMYVGTHADNMRDMKDRKRYFYARDPERCRAASARGGRANNWSSGARNPKAKLEPAQLELIKSSPLSSYQIARSLGVNASTVQRVRRGSSWHAKGDRHD